MKKKLLFLATGLLALAFASFSALGKASVAKADGEHVCGHVCSICGGCMDPDCDDPACATKCPGEGNHVLYSEDFSNGAGDFGENVSVTNGVATIVKENVGFDVNYFPRLSKNNYKISFDVNMDSANKDNFFIHLVGLNATDTNNIYLTIQADGYICLNVWKNGVWNYVYGFQNGLGGFGKANVEWYPKGSGQFHHLDFVIYEGFFELWVDGAKYLAQHVSQFGAYSNNDNNTSAARGRYNLVQGTFTGLFFHSIKKNNIEFDNFVVRDLPKVRNSFTLEKSTTPVNYTFDKGYSVNDLDHSDFRVDLVFDIVDLTKVNKYAMLHLHGLNGLLGLLDTSYDGLNVQLNFDDGLGAGHAYACMYWNNDPSNSGSWGMDIHPPIDLSGKTGTFTLSYVSLGDHMQLLVDNEIITDTTYTTTGMVKGHLNSIGASDGADFATYKSISYTALASAEEKTAAKAELAAYKAAADYREAQQTELATIVTNGNTAIDAAYTLDELNEALAAAKALADAVKTNAQLTAEELAAAKTTAKGQLDAWSTAHLSEYRQAEQDQITAGIAQAKTQIDAAETVAAVEAIITALQAQLANVKTAAQYEAEEAAAAAALASAKEAAVAELAAYKSASDYREAEQTQLATIVSEGTVAINAATDVAGVNAALAAAKAQADALKTKAQYEAEEAQPQPEPQPEQPDQGGEQGGETPAEPEQPAKKGCGSSVLAASALISTLALAGFGLLISKKRKD